MATKKKASTTVTITPETIARGRKPLAKAEQHGPEFVGKTPASMAEPEARMNLAIREAEGNAQALAVQLGYEGSLSVGALEDEIRFYQRRTVEACMELGKRLLILRELAPEDFRQRAELLGLDYTMATRFMGAAVKFAKVAAPQLLAAAGNQSKLLELLVLDGDEIEALEAGESARGITLDDVDTMSMRELRAALREVREDGEAKDRLIADKNIKIDELAKKGKRKADPWPDEIAGLKDDLHGLGLILDEALGKHLTLIDATEIEIDKHAEDEKSPALAGYKTVVHHLGEQIERLCTLVAGLQAEYETRLAGYVALDKMHVLPE